MIDPLSEDTIWPTVAADLYPRGPEGRKVHVSRVYRDMKRGRYGIVLESIHTPRLATSRQAVARFFQRLTEVRQSASGRTSQTEPARERANVEVERELDRLGL